MAVSFAHIVNPYTADDGSVGRIQDITLRSLKNAADAANSYRVELLTAQFSKDRASIPQGFTPTSDLDRSVVDVGNFSNPRRYPFIADILRRAHDASAGEFIIYSNMDIIVQPYFYEALALLLKNGADALVINRRRIADRGQTAADLPVILAEVGRSHPGFDCFVMHRSLIPKFRLNGVCVGVPFLEASVLYNLLALARDCRIHENLHLTTHLGLDVMPPRDREYHRYNQECFNVLLAQLKPMLTGKPMPYHSSGIVHRTLKRALNPSIFTALHLELEGKSMGKRLYSYWNELRFRLLHR